jgi:hypothetical protein
VVEHDAVSSLLSSESGGFNGYFLQCGAANHSRFVRFVENGKEADPVSLRCY